MLTVPLRTIFPETHPVYEINNITRFEINNITRFEITKTMRSTLSQDLRSPELILLLLNLLCDIGSVGNAPLATLLVLVVAVRLVLVVPLRSDLFGAKLDFLVVNKVGMTH